MKFQKLKKIKDVDAKNADWITESDIYHLIKTGDKHKNLVIEARIAGKENPIYDKNKHKVPKIMWYASFQNKINNNNVESLTNFIYCDLDDVTNIDVIKDELKQFPFIRAIWKSFGAKGLGFVVKCNNVTAENYKDIYHAIGKYIGYNLCEKACKITQGNVLSFDPDIYINEDPTVFDTSEIVINKNKLNNKKGNYSEKTISYKERCQVGQGNSKSIPAPINNKIQVDIDTLRISDSFFSNNNDEMNINYRVPYTYQSIYIIKEKRTWWVNDTKYNNTKFKTKIPETQFKNEDYKVFYDGFEYVEAYVPKGAITQGQRTFSLINLTAKIIYLNPSYSCDDVLNVVKRINNDFVNPKLAEEKVIKIVSDCWSRYINGNLVVNYKMRKIAFNPKSTLCKEEKLSICGKVSAEMRRNKTLGNLQNAMLQLFAEREIITQKKVAIVSGVSIRTVKRYWQQDIEIIKEINEEIKQIKLNTNMLDAA